MDLKTILDEATQHLADITSVTEADAKELAERMAAREAAEKAYETKEAQGEAELTEHVTKTTEAFLAYAKALEKK